MLRGHLNAREILQIEFNRGHSRIRFCCRLQYALPAAGDDDLVAELMECFSESPAYSGAPACDEDCVPS